MDLEKTICPMVWDHLCINTRGSNRLCCNAETQDMDFFLENYENHWNELRTKVKKDMLNGQRPAICNSCWKKEDADISSLRTQTIFKYKKNNQWEDFLQRLYMKKPSPVELDLKLGNYCNLSCRMCNSYSSSTYAAELKRIKKATDIDLSSSVLESKYKQNQWFQDPEFISRIKHFIDNGAYDLKFTGGEPLMVPGVEELIDYCIETDKAKDIGLQFITNGTLITTEWLKKLTNFKVVVLTVSIDGTEDTYEYIRHPTNWKDTYKNLLNIKQFADLHHQIRLELTFTLQIYNMFQIENMLNLRRELDCLINCIALDNPDYFDVSNAPEEAKKDALDIVKNIKLEEHFNEQRFVQDVQGKLTQPRTKNEFYCKHAVVLYSTTKDPFRNQSFSQQEVYKYYE